MKKESEDEDKLEKESEDKDKLEKESEDKDKDKLEKESEDDKVDEVQARLLQQESGADTIRHFFPFPLPFPHPLPCCGMSHPFPLPMRRAPVRFLCGVLCPPIHPPPPDHKVS